MPSTTSRTLARAIALSASVSIALAACASSGGDESPAVVDPGPARELCEIAADLNSGFNVTTTVGLAGALQEATALNDASRVPAAAESTESAFIAFAGVLDEGADALGTGVDGSEALTQFADFYEHVGTAIGDSYSGVETLADVELANAALDVAIGGYTGIEPTDADVIAVNDHLVAECGIELFDGIAEFAQGAEESAARADVSLLGKEIATYWVDGVEPPAVEVVDGTYVVAGVEVGEVSRNVEIFDQEINGATDWCVAVTNTAADATFRYSAQAGLEAGSCADR